MMSDSNFFPKHIFKCAVCGSDEKQGFDVESLFCNHCKTEFFALHDMRCLFPTGIQQKVIWEHLVAIMQESSTQGLAELQYQLSRFDITEATRRRLTETLEASEVNVHAILSLLQEAGIKPTIREELRPVVSGNMYEYFDFILRDWGWDTVAAPSHENAKAFNRVMDVVKTLPVSPRRILVLGAGVGRLSWDLHAALKPEYTIALDSNPLLLTVANRLIREQKPIELAEFKFLPPIDLPASQIYALKPPDDPDNVRSRWFALAANFWHLPLNAGCFDLVVTPWFIDVNGGDIRNLIGVISQSLSNNGHWINTGPLLYSNELAIQYKYNSAEIREFIALSGFTLLSENTEQSGHLISPMDKRSRTEQIWTFNACKSEFADVSAAESYPHAWLVMHHLPVTLPVLNHQHIQFDPLTNLVLTLIDGHRSITEICSVIAPFAADIPVEDFVVSVLGQLISEP